MPNPTGKNQFLGLPKEPPYGDIKKLEQLTKAAPLSGAPFPALRFPDRAKEASQDLRRIAIAPERSENVAVPVLDYKGLIASIWQELARHPEASDLVRSYAARL